MGGSGVSRPAVRAKKGLLGVSLAVSEGVDSACPEDGGRSVDSKGEGTREVGPNTHGVLAGNARSLRSPVGSGYGLDNLCRSATPAHTPRLWQSKEVALLCKVRQRGTGRGCPSWRGKPRRRPAGLVISMSVREVHRVRHALSQSLVSLVHSSPPSGPLPISLDAEFAREPCY